MKRFRKKLKIFCVLGALIFALPFLQLTDGGSPRGFGYARAAEIGGIIYISSPQELKDLSDYVNAGDDTTDMYYQLAGNIDLVDFLKTGGAGFSAWGENGWNPIGCGNFTQPIFTGTFDGAGYNITGLWTKGRISNIGGIGLFGRNGGVIKNLTVYADTEKGGIDGELNVGGIAGLNEGLIENCSFYGAVLSEENSGGIAGVNKHKITDCVNFGDVSGTVNSGGIAGKNYGKISCSANVGTIGTSAGSAAGGIAGRSSGGEILQCANYGEAKTASNFSGGITGYTVGTSIQDCYNTGEINSLLYAGGIVGFAENGTDGGDYYSGVEIYYCYNTGLISGSGQLSAIANTTQTSVIANCFYDKDSSGGVVENSGVPLTARVLTGSNFLSYLSSGSDIWTRRNPDTNHYYPELKAFYKDLPDTELQRLSKEKTKSGLIKYTGNPVLETGIVVYGMRLEDIKFKSVTEGVFSWQEPDFIPNAGSSVKVLAKFEPTDERYGELENIELVIKVEKAEAIITVSINGWQVKNYSEENKPKIEIVAGGESGQIIYSYKKIGEPDSAYSENIPVKAGKYIVRAVLAESQNYLAASAYFEFEIKGNLSLLYILIIISTLAFITLIIYFTNKKYGYLQKIFKKR